MKARKVIVSVGIISSLFLSGCSTQAGPAPADEQATNSASSSASPSASATPSPTATEKTNSSKSGIPTKGGAGTDTNGEYAQTTIADTDPAMKYNLAIVDPAVLGAFSEEEVANFQKTMIRFVAEEVIDSSVNVPNGDVDVSIQEFEKWWAANSGLFYEGTAQELYDGVVNNPVDSSLLISSQWRDGKYEAERNSDNTRVSSRTITPTSITLADNNGLPYLNIFGTLEYSVPVKGGGTETVTGGFRYSSVLEDGKWKIAGYQSEYTSTANVMTASS